MAMASSSASSDSSSMAAIEATAAEFVSPLDPTAPSLSARVQEILQIESRPLSGPSPYLRPVHLDYKQAGESKVWHVAEAHDAVSVLVYHKKLDGVLLVRQFRPPVYLAAMRDHLERKPEVSPNRDSSPDADAAARAAAIATGFTFELCAGMVDKHGKSLEQTAAEEVLEECGFRVSASDLELVTRYRSATGLLGYRTSMFYCEVDDSMRVEGAGGGIDDEVVDVMVLPCAKALRFALEPSLSKPAGLMSCMLWFLSAKRGLHLEF